MATPQSFKLLDVCRVSPPSGSVPETSLPLTVFDVYWIGVPPIQRLFFYELNTTTTHFIDLLLPKIKHSLSLSLRFYFSLAGNIHLSHSDGNHEIRYVEGDSVSLTVAESDGDFHRLVQNNPKGAREVCPFLPQLASPSLLALQFTIFPNAGMAIGISIHHSVGDGRSLAHFMKSWSSICRNGNDTCIIQPPFVLRLGLCYAAAKRSDLLSEHGLLAATKAIRKAIRRLEEEGPMKGLENSIAKSVKLLGQRLVSVAGSPQFRVYDIDSGRRRPKITEVKSMDITGAIYIGDSRDEEGGIEVGLSLPEQEMDSFASLFQEGLEQAS